MEPQIHWIRREDDLAALRARVGDGPVAVDTEADSMHHYPEKVCLVQLSFGGHDYLLDPLGDLEPAPLAGLLGDPGVRKVFHGADYDLRVLDRDFGIRTRGLFDTMIAARLVGERRFGLAALLERRLGVHLDKKYQRADWSRRPLPEPMVRYAVLDTRYLVELANGLTDDLRRLGRESWAEEEFRRLEGIRWTASRNDESFRRIRGASRLDRRGLAVLRELDALRDRIALDSDRPPFKVLSADALVALATARPVDPGDLSEIRELPGRWSGGEPAQRIVAAIRRAMGLGEGELPERADHRRPPRDPRFEREVKRLSRKRDALAERLDLEASIIAPRAVLEEAVRRLRGGKDPLDQDDLRTWQADLLRPVFGDDPA